MFRALGLLALGGPVIQHSFCPSRSRVCSPPPPPSSVTAFCCQHVALVDSSRADSDQAWVDLPSRHTAWMPVFNRGTGRWDPEWVCLRCNENLTGHHPLLQNVPPSLCKLPDKINGFGAPPPAHLDGKHNKAASGIALHQLGIRALFCPPSKAQRGPRRPTLVASGAGCGCQSRHQGSVDGKLSAAPQGQAIGNDFDAAVVSGDTGDVQVPYQRVHADGGTSLPTHSGGCTFEWDAAPAQDTRPRASGPVVPQGITHMTTRAPGRAEWQRHA